MVISVAGASTWLSICSQWGIENICFIAILTLYPQECSILPIFTSRFETDPPGCALLHRTKSAFFALYCSFLLMTTKIN